MTSKLLIQSQRNLMMVDYQGAFAEEMDLEVCSNTGGNNIKEFTQLSGASSAFVVCKGTNIHLVSLVTKSVTKTVSAASSGTFEAKDLTFLEGRRFAISMVYDSTNSAGEIKFWDMKAEVPCDGSCGDCGWVSTKDGCTSCTENHVLRLDSTCGGGCYNGEYVSSPNVCSRCDSSCKTCDGGGSNQCLSCESPKVRRTDGVCGERCFQDEYLDEQNRCQKCSAFCKACSKAGETGCTSCPDDQTLQPDGSCPAKQPNLSIYHSLYSLSVGIEGIKDSGEVSIYLRITLQAENLNFSFLLLQELIDNKHFSIEAESLDKVGDASYNKTTKLLNENGRVSPTQVNSIEYLVYKAEMIPLEKGGEFSVSVTPNQPNIKYSGGEPAALITIEPRQNTQLVSIPPIKGTPMKIKNRYGIALQASVATTKIVGGVLSVASSLICFYSLGFMSRFFQIIEVIINLSLVNTKLGSLIEAVLEILRALKFPFSLPEDLFWPEYVADSHVLFWKDRFKLSVHEKQLFILCNETLMVIVYLLTWVLWLSALAVKRLCCEQRVESAEELKDWVLKSDGQELQDKSQNSLDFFSRDKDQGSRQERGLESNSGFVGSSQEDFFKERNHGRVDDLDGSSPMRFGLQKRSSMAGSRSSLRRYFHQKGSLLQKKGRVNSDFEEGRSWNAEISKKEKIGEVQKPKIDKVIKFLEEVKRFFFSFSYFDVQFITFHELLHSDVNRMDGMWSRGAISYTLSFVVLCLMIYDLRWLMDNSTRLIWKKKEQVELTKEEKQEAEFFFEDIKTEPEISFLAMNFNLISMVRFSFYQLIIASVQLSPNFQTGFLLTLQITFFTFYLNKYRKEKFFESWYPFMTFVVIETCILVFLLLSLIFSFENVGLWFTSTITAWLQILAATMILIAAFVEFLTLVLKAAENVIEMIKMRCQKKSNENKKRVVLYPERAKFNQMGQMNNPRDQGLKGKDGDEDRLAKGKNVIGGAGTKLKPKEYVNNRDWMGFNPLYNLHDRLEKSKPIKSTKLRVNQSKADYKNNVKSQQKAKVFITFDNEKKSHRAIGREKFVQNSEIDEKGGTRSKPIEASKFNDLFNLNPEEKNSKKNQEDTVFGDNNFFRISSERLLLDSKNMKSGFSSRRNVQSPKNSEAKNSPKMTLSKFSRKALNNRVKLSTNKIRAQYSLRSKLKETDSSPINLGNSLSLEEKDKQIDTEKQKKPSLLNNGGWLG